MADIKGNRGNLQGLKLERYGELYERTYKNQDSIKRIDRPLIVVQVPSTLCKVEIDELWGSCQSRRASIHSRLYSTHLLFGRWNER
jgi:hypothetical protein